ncbi:MAG: hypothetical protein JSS02_14235 [Planctomycetes bacterium]|nr:hypothetical protein [Planctomycetota bacterium]
MSKTDKPHLVNFQGREHQVLFAHLYVGDYYDIWLLDVATQKVTEICTTSDASVPFGDRQRLVFEPFVDLLAEAGIVRPTGETVETAEQGTLHICEVPVRKCRPICERPRSQAASAEDIHLTREDRERDIDDELER